MRPRASRRLQSVIGIALAGVLFVAVVLLAETLLVGVRIDLTEEGLYTLSGETRDIVDNLDEPIELTLYFSRDAAEGVPFVRQYAQRVRELLAEYAALSGGRLRVRTVDPKPLTRERDRARRYGLKRIPVGSDDDTRLFLGLVATNRTDGVETIDFFDPERERFLEYDISRLIWSLAHPDKPVIGIVSPLDMTRHFNPATGKEEPAWAVVDRLEQVAEVRTVETPTDRIDSDIDLLMVAHPHDYDDSTLYAVDQYLTHGGRAAVFLDPVAEMASGSGRAQPKGRMSRSDAGPLLKAWGVDVTLDRAVADPRNGLVVSAGQGSKTIHPGLIGITRTGLAQRDVITAAIERLVFASPGVITDGPGGLDVKPLVQAAPSAGLLPAGRFVGLDDPQELARGLQPIGKPLTLVARLQGDLRSAWPSGPPDDSDARRTDHLAAAAEPAHLVLFADADVLSDRLWVKQRQQGDEMVRKAWSDNGDLIVNVVQNLLGSDALIGLRGEGTSARPFTRLQALRRQAADRYRDRERNLREALEQTRGRLETLRSGREAGADGVILSEQQQSELANQRERRNRLRRQLREVRQRLDARIDALGDRLRLLNIVVVPALVALFGLFVFLVRRHRRRRPARQKA